jgi:hypothetical protein
MLQNNSQGGHLSLRKQSELHLLEAIGMMTSAYRENANQNSSTDVNNESKILISSLVSICEYFLDMKEGKIGDSPMAFSPTTSMLAQYCQPAVTNPGVIGIY